jgi:CheY-like chemotaxis protein
MDDIQASGSASNQTATSDSPVPSPLRQIPPFSCKRLLLVEDNVDARQTLAATLRRRGFEVAEAADGRTALDALQKFPADVAIVDLGLPVMNGYQVARAIRGNPALRQMLLIALTGYGDEDNRQATAAAGFDLHIVKPVNPRELVEFLSASSATASTYRSDWRPNPAAKESGETALERK